MKHEIKIFEFDWLAARVFGTEYNRIFHHKIFIPMTLHLYNAAIYNLRIIFPDEGIYNTYVLDIDVNGDKSWVLLLHCAEKSGTARYLSSFIMGRRSTLPVNVIAYLQDKLPRYDIDLQYLFQMQQNECTPTQPPLFFQTDKTSKTNKHPLKHPSH